jgi:tetratricopeptide (TPR) repeat protein
MKILCAFMLCARPVLGPDCLNLADTETVEAQITRPGGIPKPNLNGVQDSVREQIDAAEAELESISRSASNNHGKLADAYGSMGKLYHTYDFADAAEACYQNAASFAPKNFVWPYYLGRLYQQKGEVSKSITNLKLAHDLRPAEIPPLVRLAEAYLADSQSKTAKEFFEQSLKLDRSLAASMAGLAKIALSERKFTNAIQLLQAALELQPKATSLHYPLAMAYRSLGNKELAKDHLQRQGLGKAEYPDPLMDDLEKLKKGPMVLWRQGNQAVQEGRYPDAVTLFSKMVDSTTDPLPRIYLGNALAGNGDLKGAMNQYYQVLRQMPRNATAHYDLGVVLLQLSSETEAMNHFQAAITADPTLKVAHFQLANLLMRNKKFEAAVAHYSRVIQLSPEHEFARLMKCIALVGLKQFRAARRDLEEAVASLPESRDLALALARLLSASPDKSARDAVRAVQIVEKVLKTHPSADFDVVETYAMVMASNGRLTEAANLQRRMIATVQSTRRHDLVAVLQRNLRLYEQGQACSTPWRDDDPIFAPQPGKMTLIVPRDVSGIAQSYSEAP